MEETITINKAQLADLLNRVEEAETERTLLKDACIKIMAIMGFIDNATGKVKADIISGEESFIPSMLKSLGDITALLTKSRLGKLFGGETAKEQLAQKFDFIQKLIPLINKYGN